MRRCWLARRKKQKQPGVVTQGPLKETARERAQKPFRKEATKKKGGEFRMEERRKVEEKEEEEGEEERSEV